MTKFIKTNFELSPYGTDIRKIMVDNSVRDIQEMEDKRFMEAMEATMKPPLKPPFWKWFDRGIVHMTGLTFLGNAHIRETTCGILPENINYPTSDHPGSVTCLSCLAL